MSRLSIALVGAALAILGAGAQATTYILPSDYGVACLELQSGKLLWRRPGKLTRPDLRIQGGVLVAEDPQHQKSRQRLELDPATGKAKRLKKIGPVIPQVPPLPVNLRTAAGLKLAFDSGNTRHIETDSGKVLKRIDWFPSNLLVTGDVAVFNTHDGKGGSEIYGWDLAAGRLAWQIEVDRYLSDLREGAYVDFAVDGDRLFVAADQRILAFALGAAAPRLLWKTPLPRQSIRMYDAPWTTFARHGEVLFAVVYEDLVALRVSDGALLWTFDGGMLGNPWPLVHDGRVYLSYRAGEVDPSSWSNTGKHGAAISALEIRRSKKRWTIVPITRAAIPAGAARWSILHQPPPPRAAKSPVVLTLTDNDGDAYSVDLTSASAGAGPLYVTFHGFFHGASLRTGRRAAATASW